MAKQIQKPVSEEDIRSYEREWAAMMVHIWRENMLRLGVVRTKALYNSLTHSVTGAADQITIAHQFMLYGIYIARGVGRGYTRGNPGDLEFLDKSYRKTHRLDKPRKKGPAWGGGYTSGKPREQRDWFSRKYLRSIHVLTEVELSLYGEAYMGTLSNVLSALFGDSRVTGSQGTDVSNTISAF